MTSQPDLPYEKADVSNKSRLARIAAMNLTVLNFSGVYPRSPKHWVFGHQGELFAGNSRYLYLWITIHRPDIKVAWIAHDEGTHRVLNEHGLPCHRKWSSQGVKAALRSKVFFFTHGLSDINARLSKGAYLVNLWHGVGLKATMFGDVRGIMSDYRRNWNNRRGRLMFYEYVTLPDVVATTSDFTQRHFSEQFELPPERCPQLGYPRLDVAADPELRALSAKIDRSIGFDFNAEGRDEVYLYMPTWRDTHRPFVAEALPDLERLSRILAERNAVMYVKLHPWTREGWTADLDNIRLWPTEIDVYTYLEQVSGLITDYSSILYDYLYLKDTGSIVYTFDYDHYLSTDRSMIYPFDENTAGVRASSFDELCRVIEDGEALRPDAKTAVVREKFWGTRKPPVSPGIVDYVERAIGSGLRRAKAQVPRETARQAGDQPARV